MNSIIGTFCGLYRNGTHGHRFTFGVIDEVLAGLEAEDACYHRHGPMTTVVHYNEIVLCRVIERLIDQAGIIPVVGATLRNVRREGRRVEELEFVTRWGDVKIRAEGFADCSGDAALTYRAGFDCREPDEKVYGSQQAVIEGIAIDAEQPQREEMSAKIAEKAEEYGPVRRNGLVFCFPGKDVAVLNMTHVETPLDPTAASRTAWPIELHNAPEGFLWNTFGEDHVRYAPLRAMIPDGADNIVAVGRCIDGDPAALSSVRVMGPCMAMGAAAAHALDLAGSGSVQQIDISALQDRLSDNLTRTDGVAP